MNKASVVRRGRRWPPLVSVGAVAAGAAMLVGTLAPVAVSAQSPPSSAPSAVAEATDWRQVDAGGQHTCGIRASGRLYCWGRDDQGQLGNGPGSASTSTPGAVAGGATNWTAVSAGFSHTCALRTSGALYCWGNDAFGALGNGGQNLDAASPTPVAGGHTDWVSVSAGQGTTCARRAGGSLWCWGSDSKGTVGDGGGLVDRGTPVGVAGTNTGWTSVSVGGGHACGRRSTGRLYCWGLDAYGEVGDGPGDGGQNHPSPVAVGPRTDWASVTAGGAHTCGRTTLGELWCWGIDTFGQLGNGGTNTTATSPTRVGSATDWANPNAGPAHTCARKQTGRLYCWGSDANGQVGDGPPRAEGVASPVPVAGGHQDWSAPAVDGYHVCARRGGSLYCWGDNQWGQLGRTGSSTVNAPAVVTR